MKSQAFDLNGVLKAAHFKTLSIRKLTDSEQGQIASKIHELTIKILFAQRRGLQKGR